MKNDNVGVLIERVHYYNILVEGGCTIREGVLIEECALTEVVRYVYSSKGRTNREVFLQNRGALFGRVI